jgi:hypothetical protein
MIVLGALAELREAHPVDAMDSHIGRVEERPGGCQLEGRRGG